MPDTKYFPGTQIISRKTEYYYPPTARKHYIEYQQNRYGYVLKEEVYFHNNDMPKEIIEYSEKGIIESKVCYRRNNTLEMSISYDPLGQPRYWYRYDRSGRKVINKGDGEPE
jgi:antitoxin component YwqK of YwqJK toxin-antitoxin module